MCTEEFLALGALRQNLYLLTHVIQSQDIGNVDELVATWRENKRQS
jgi:hypothetical protein